MKITTQVMLLTSCLAGTAQAASLNVQQVLQQVMDHYPSLKTAAMQVEKAQQESIRVQSQLGWQLGAQAGINRDISFFGTPVDSTNVSGNISRLLESGSTLSVKAGVQYQDSETSVLPTLPNPATTTSIDLSYRLPLQKGADNPALTEGLASAKTGVILAQAETRALYDQLATQVIDLHLAAATTLERIKNTNEAIKRSQRLKKYIKDRAKLGLSEDKDILQVQAQLHGQQAQLQALEMAWVQQRISLNRLMGRNWEDEFVPAINQKNTLPSSPMDELLQQSQMHSPTLARAKGRMQLADSTIKSRRDARKDQLDLVMFIGNRTNDGDTAGGSVSESDLVGGVSLEFGRGLDNSGRDAELYQAQLERGIAIQDQRQIIEDLQYDLATLLAEINTGQQALSAYRQSLKSEQAKLDEAEQRYRRGRTDTDQLIQFENQLIAAELALSLQQIELQRRFYKLELLRGVLWQQIKTPEFDITVEELTRGDAS